MAIRCCYGCVPPQRTSECHGTCKRYIEEKAADEVKKASENAKRKTNNDIYMQKVAGITRAKKRHGGK